MVVICNVRGKQRFDNNEAMAQMQSDEGLFAEPRTIARTRHARPDTEIGVAIRPSRIYNAAPIPCITKAKLTPLFALLTQIN